MSSDDDLRPRFHRGLTLLLALLVCLSVCVIGSWGSFRRALGFEHPARTTREHFERAIELEAALQDEPEWLRRTVTVFLGRLRPALSEAIKAVPDLTWEEVRTSGFVVHTVQAAFWALHHATSYPDGIIKITNLGEDTDTAGATAGILLGAKFGVDGIPKSWREQLQNVKKLSGLADQIHTLATQSALG